MSFLTLHEHITGCQKLFHTSPRDTSICKKLAVCQTPFSCGNFSYVPLLNQFHPTLDGFQGVAINKKSGLAWPRGGGGGGTHYISKGRDVLTKRSCFQSLSGTGGGGGVGTGGGGAVSL